MNQHALESLLQQPVWSKNVVVWIGSEETLDNARQGVQHIRLDLLELLPDDQDLPVGQEERGEMLQSLLDRRLQESRPKGSYRVVLCVRNAALLARYGVGLGSFYDWFAGSNTMTILEIPRIKPVELPGTVAESVRFDPAWLTNYLRPLLLRPENLCIET